MPTLNVKTSESEQVWASPDGQRKIYKVTLDFEGKPVAAKTYSDAIAAVGWEGTVETYEKPGRNGNETFVKQPPKENPGYGGSQASTPAGGGKSSKPAFDNYTMYLSYAKDLAVALVGTKEGFSDEKYAELLDAVNTGGDVLYAGRPDAPKDEPVEIKPVVTPMTVEMPEGFGLKEEDQVHDVLEGQITLDEVIEDVFPGAKKVK